MSDKKDDKISKKTIIGWIVTLAAALIGAFGITTAVNNINIYIDGKSVSIDKNNAQAVYSEIENEKNELNSQVGSLEEEKNELSSQVNDLRKEKENLNDELEQYRNQNEYKPKNAEVSTNPNYAKDEVSIFSFTPVKCKYWKENEGTLTDSLDNKYDVDKPFVVIYGGSYAKYYTKGQFSKLKFTIAPHESMGRDSSATIKISTDSGTVKTIENINRSFIPQNYSVDLKGSDFVTIQCDYNSGWYDQANVMLLDATFYK